MPPALAPDSAVFLRGMNLGGRRITNDALRVHFEEIGLREVGVFRASGNVVFAAPGREQAAELTARIEGALASVLGYTVAVFLRTAPELRGVAAVAPFAPAELAASNGKLQVMLLGVPPDPAARREVLALAPAEDLLAFGERELYWLPSGGLLESTLDTKAIATLLGPATVRTMGTIAALVGKYFTCT